MAAWFTSDTHFGHGNIIKHCSRPFASVEEMDETMIARWNERVSHGDTVYHLGDFSLTDHTPYLQKLNGQKRLVLGNHDNSKFVKKAVGWATVDDILHVTVEDTFLVLCHYAMRVWHRSHHGSLHLYGHSHGKLKGTSRSCDVGVDCWDFRPVSLTEIKAFYRRQAKRIESANNYAEH